MSATPTARRLVRRAVGVACYARGVSSSRTQRAEIEERIRVAETLLVQRVRVSAVVDHLVRTYGVSENSARRYVDAVRERWRAGAPKTLEAREARRDEIRATIDEAIRRALARTKPLVDRKGAPVMRTVERQVGDTVERVEEPVAVESPDLRAALHGLRLAMQLDALEGVAGRETTSAPSEAPASSTAETLAEAEAQEAATGTDAPPSSTLPSAAELASRLKGQGRFMVLAGGRGRATEE